MYGVVAASARILSLTSIQSYAISLLLSFTLQFPSSCLCLFLGVSSIHQTASRPLRIFSTISFSIYAGHALSPFSHPLNVRYGISNHSETSRLDIFICFRASSIVIRSHSLDFLFFSCYDSFIALGETSRMFRDVSPRVTLYSILFKQF